MIINPEEGFIFRFYKTACDGYFEFCIDEDEPKTDGTKVICKSHDSNDQRGESFYIEVKANTSIDKNGHILVNEYMYGRKLDGKYIYLTVKSTWNCGVFFWAKEYLRYSDRNLSPYFEDVVVSMFFLGAAGFAVMLGVIVFWFRHTLLPCCFKKTEQEAEPPPDANVDIEKGQAAPQAEPPAPQVEETPKVEPTLKAVKRRAEPADDDDAEPEPSGQNTHGSSALTTMGRKLMMEKWRLEKEKKKLERLRRSQSPANKRGSRPKAKRGQQYSESSNVETTSQQKQKSSKSEKSKQKVARKIRAEASEKEKRPMNKDKEKLPERQRKPSEISQVQPNVKDVRKEDVSTRPSDVEGPSTVFSINNRVASSNKAADATSSRPSEVQGPSNARSRATSAAVDPTSSAQVFDSTLPIDPSRVSSKADASSKQFPSEKQ
uniref:Uncharacterized protein n=1 Tax=Panagrolaimus sp. JU765 TaxID=591449 RepID=A0AC34QG34_9BILA